MSYYWKEMRKRYDKMRKQLKNTLERITYENRKVLESDWDNKQDEVWTHVCILLWGVAAIIISVTLF